MNQLPFVFNLVIYPDRDALLYQDMCSIPSKYRAERLRKLASLALVLPPLVGELDVRIPASVNSGDGDQGAVSGDNIDVKMTINSYTHNELFNDIAAMPKGHLSQRIKLLAEAGLIYQQLSGALNAGKGSVVAKASVAPEPKVHRATQYQTIIEPASSSVGKEATVEQQNNAQIEKAEVEKGDALPLGAGKNETPTREPSRRRSTFDGVKM